MSNRHVNFKENPKRKEIFDLDLGTPRRSKKPISIVPPAVRWVCHHHSYGSDIEAYVLARNGLAILAQTIQADDLDARATAELIVKAVNDYGTYQPLIVELMTALKQCLDDGLNWGTEQEADAVLRRAEKVVSV